MLFCAKTIQKKKSTHRLLHFSFLLLLKQDNSFFKKNNQFVYIRLAPLQSAPDSCPFLLLLFRPNVVVLNRRSLTLINHTEAEVKQKLQTAGLSYLDFLISVLQKQHAFLSFFALKQSQEERRLTFCSSP